MNNNIKLGFRIKFLFGLGWPIEYIVLRSLELFVLFYYTQVLGLSGWLAGLALFIAMLFDAFADPAIGAFSDNLRNSRFGRRHSLMFLAPIPLGISFMLVFLPPSSLSGLALFAWLTVTAIAVRFTCGLYIVPYSAQLAEMTRDPAQRASLSIYKSVTQTVFDFAMLAIAFNFFFAKNPDGSGGQGDASAYLPFALTLGLALAATALISAFGTYRYMRAVEKQSSDAIAKTPRQRLSFTGIIAAWRRVLFGNSNVRAIVVGAMFSAIATSASRSLTSHLGIFFWELTPEQIGFWQQATIPGLFAGMLIARLLTKRIELIRLVLIGLLLMFATLALPPLLRLLDVIPGNGTTFVFGMLLFSSFIMGTGSGILLLLAGIVCAEAADEEEFLVGLPQQGFLFGFVFLSTKMGSAIGKLISGAALDIIDFPLGATTVAVSVVNSLAWALIGTIIVLGSISYYFWSRYHLPKKRYSEILNIMSARNK